jgi:hypothetical protein
MTTLAEQIEAINPRAVPGGNNPPSPFELVTKAVEDIYSECALWLDGAHVDSQDMADGIANLMVTITKAEKLAEENRKTEKKPFDDGAKEVQARYKPLLDKADLAKAACKKALAPWLKKLADETEAKARAAREEADAKRQAAEEAIRTTDAANLAERAAAEALVAAAKQAETAANKAARETATAGGMMGRATGLRTVYAATITSPLVFGRYAWVSHREEYDAFLQQLANRLVRSGVRSLPGVNISEEKGVV